MNAKDVGDFVKEYRTSKQSNGEEQSSYPKGIAKALTDKALELQSTDNISVVVVFFE